MFFVSRFVINSLRKLHYFQIRFLEKSIYFFKYILNIKREASVDTFYSEINSIFLFVVSANIIF